MPGRGLHREECISVDDRVMMSPPRPIAGGSALKDGPGFSSRLIYPDILDHWISDRAPEVRRPRSKLIAGRFLKEFMRPALLSVTPSECGVSGAESK